MWKTEFLVISASEVVQYRLHVDKMPPDNRLSRYSKTNCLSNRPVFLIRRQKRRSYAS